MDWNDELKAAGTEIDLPIRSLVYALNEIPGVYTFDSCGGHPNPILCQEPEGTWRVNFEIEHNARGWKALDLLARTTERFLPEELGLTVWSDGGPNFTLRGTCPPTPLARRIRRALSKT